MEEKKRRHMETYGKIKSFLENTCEKPCFSFSMIGEDYQLTVPPHMAEALGLNSTKIKMRDPFKIVNELKMN
jgi:hypothetical protein